MESKGLGPFRLAPWFSERIWGRRDLRPWYETTGTNELVGEAWLTAGKCVIETGAQAGRTLGDLVAEAGEELLGVGGAGEFPLLVKLLFPNDKLSVQVHPDDVLAQAMGEARGKTECWYVLEAEPGATVGLGLKDGVTPEAVVAACGTGGDVEGLMEWVPVRAGDMVFVDAGTVHAIGPGVVLLETQQMSDLTYRLYDYGRPRELHLEQGMRAMRTKTAAGKVRPAAMDGFTRLIAQRYFVVDRFDVAAGDEVTVATEGAGCVVGLSGMATVDGVELMPGRAVVVPVGCGTVRVRTRGGASFVRCFVPVG